MIKRTFVPLSSDAMHVREAGAGGKRLARANLFQVWQLKADPADVDNVHESVA